MSEYAVIDDFLPLKDWEGIYNSVLAVPKDSDHSYFEWQYSEKTIREKESTSFQFTHLFYCNGSYTKDSYIVEPIIEKIAPDSLNRVKANLLTITQNPCTDDWHIDQKDEGIDKYSAVYYVNDNNGYTAFKGGDKIKSKANRLLVFKNNLYHTSVRQSDVKARVVINVAFSKKGGCLGVK